MMPRILSQARKEGTTSEGAVLEEQGPNIRWRDINVYPRMKLPAFLHGAMLRVWLQVDQVKRRAQEFD